MLYSRTVPVPNSFEPLHDTFTLDTTMSLSSTDIALYAVGTVITIAVARWLFSRVDNRPPNSPSLYFSYSPDPDSVSELQRMFPNIPQRFIIRELDRANGVVSSAVDALVLINPDFSDSTSPTLSNDVINGQKVTHQEIIQEIISKPEEELSAIEEPIISRKDWDTIDPKTRQRVLAERKKAMLLKARDAFRKSKENN